MFEKFESSTNILEEFTVNNAIATFALEGNVFHRGVVVLVFLDTADVNLNFTFLGGNLLFIREVFASLNLLYFAFNVELHLPGLLGDDGLSIIFSSDDVPKISEDVNGVFFSIETAHRLCFEFLVIQSLPFGNLIIVSLDSIGVLVVTAVDNTILYILLKMFRLRVFVHLALILQHAVVFVKLVGSNNITV